MKRRQHPQDVSTDATWARLAGTTGDKHHIFAGGCASPKTLCGYPINPHHLRGAPTKEYYPKATACPTCVLQWARQNKQGES